MASYKPKIGQKYWMINSRFAVVQAIRTNSTRCKGRVVAGNAFRTAAEAEQVVSSIRLGIRAVSHKWWEFWKKEDK